MTKQIPYDLIPASDLPRKPSGPYDSVVGVDEATKQAVRFPMPEAGVPKAYPTRADLPDASTMEAGTVAWVTNDPTPANNGTWTVIDGEWVLSADRVTGLEGRLSAAESDVSDLSDRADDAESGLEAVGRDILDVRDSVPDESSAFVWGVADEDGKVLAGIRPDGEFDAIIRDPFRGSEAPQDESTAAIVDGGGRHLLSWALDGTVQALFPQDVAPRPFPLDGALDDIAYGVTDEDGRLLFGVRSDGDFVAAGLGGGVGATGQDIFDADDGSVYVTTATGRRLVASGSPWPYRAPVASAGGGFRASQARPLLGSDRRVAASLDGLVVPDSAELLTHIPSYGQSLSVGQNGQPLLSVAPSYPRHVLMFAGLDVRLGIDTTSSAPALDPSTLVDFEPMVARLSPNGSYGQTPLESMANTIQRESVSRVGAPMKMMVTANGRGGTSYSGLKKGTQPYTDLMATITKAKEIAAAKGLAYWVPCICIMHGESDSQNSNYFNNIAEWQADLQADIQAITGQSAGLKLYFGQVSSFYEGRTASTLAIYRAAKELAGVEVVGPQYSVPYSGDLLHMNSEGYFRMGEYFAKALLADQYGTSGWKPLMPESVTRTGAQIDIQFHVPVGPLVLDDVTVSDPGNYGFAYADDSDSASVASVTLLDATTVRVTLDGVPTGGNKVIRYGLDGYPNPRVAGQGPRGCLRDSDSTESALGGNLYNWCLHFEESAE